MHQRVNIEAERGRLQMTKGDMCKAVCVLNEDLVTYISDWSRNNYIQKDRYHPSIYTELLVKLNAGNPADTLCIHDVSKLDTQVRLGKDRLDKDRSGEGEPPPGQRPHSLAEVEAYCASQGFTMRPERGWNSRHPCGGQAGGTAECFRGNGPGGAGLRTVPGRNTRTLPPAQPLPMAGYHAAGRLVEAVCERYLTF